jgi:hypothetical protein
LPSFISGLSLAKDSEWAIYPKYAQDIEKLLKGEKIYRVIFIQITLQTSIYRASLRIERFLFK